MSGSYWSFFDSFLSVYSASGPSFSDLSEITCAINGGSFQISVSAGSTYYIQVGSLIEGSTGDISVGLNLIPPPANDNFSNAFVISNMSFQDTVNNASATIETGEPASACSSGRENTVWYVITPSENGVLSGQHFSNFDSFLSVYIANGPSLDNLSELTCSYPNATFKVNVTQGSTYYIQIGSVYSGQSGDTTLYLDLVLPPANDYFADATVITTLPFSGGVFNIAATSESGEPLSICSPGASYNTVWYVFTPTENGLLSGSHWSDFDSFLSVYIANGPSLGDLAELTCSYNRTSFQINVTQGVTYYFQIGSLYTGNSGNTTLNLDLIQPPANDNFADAKIVTATPYQDTVDNTYATSEPGEPAGCSGFGASKTIWYAFTPTSEGILTGSVGYYYSSVTVYTGNSLDSLTQVTCANYSYAFQIAVSPGTTYYIQIGSIYYWLTGSYPLYLSFTPAPPNDDFANATVVGGLPFSSTVNYFAATTEDGEPDPGCSGSGMYHTIWYAYTPSASGSITFQKDGTFYDNFMAVYTGSSLNSLTLLRCTAGENNRFTLPLEAGVTYYIQLGGFYYGSWGDLTLEMYVPPPPNADFWWSPYDPSLYDNTLFCDSSYDPVGEGFNHFWWNFGDGTQLETSDSCVYHQYAADGDYTVWYKAQTSDGRTGEITRVISVRTHDVAITKFIVPQSASVGQTRQITVSIRNSKYPETVTVDLYKSTPYGFTWVGTLTMSVPVRPANRTTDFKFSYTFDNDDGKLGKVTFQAVATINNAPDALPADNTAISLPTKVTGYKPY